MHWECIGLEDQTGKSGFWGPPPYMRRALAPRERRGRPGFPGAEGVGWLPIRLVGGTREGMVAKALGEGSKRTTEPFRGRLLR